MCNLIFAIQLADDYLPQEQRYFSDVSQSDVIIERLVEQYDWYILPVVNPDGYEYSRNQVRSQYISRHRTGPPPLHWLHPLTTYYK